MGTKIFCRATAYVVLFFGLLGSFFVAKAYGIDMWSYRPERDWALTMGIFGGGMATICIVSSVLLGIARLIENQESINLTLKNISEEIKEKRPERDGPHIFTQSQRSISANQWKCSKCGRVNEDYVGTCACGNTKTK